MKRLMTSILSVIFFLSFAQNTTVLAVENDQLNIVGESGVVIDVETKKVIYGKKEKEKAFPASTTKVLTAILLDENTEEGEILTASENATTQECSCFVLEPGEQMTKEEAMYSLMVNSSNDVAVMIAEHISGSVEEFAKLMNKKAKEIGANDSNFVTPNGLHDPNHYTTAYDMALITREAMKHELVFDAMSAQSYLVKTNKKEKEVINHGKIFDNPNNIAGKTGFTSIAQNTLTVVAKKDNKTVISVVMKSDRGNHYTDTEAMANYAFDSIVKEDVVTKGDIVTMKMVNGEKVNLIADKDYSMTFIKGEDTIYDTEVIIEKTKKGISEGEQLGELNIIQNEKIIGKVPLVSDKEIAPVSTFKEKASSSFSVILTGIGISILVYAILTIYMNVTHKKNVNR